MKGGICEFIGCEYPNYGHGLCNAHWWQKRQNRSLTAVSRRPRNVILEDGFWRNVGERPQSGCWNWMGNKPRGYGRFKYRGKDYVAHRISWEIFNGKKLNRYERIDHLCRNRACVNPDHLEVVTHRENNLRMIGFISMQKQLQELKEYFNINDQLDDYEW